MPRPFMKERVLFFSPHAGIWVHAFPEALVAEAVGQGGAEVTYITCGGAFADYCVTMSALGVTQDASSDQKAQVCTTCRNNRTRLRQGFDLPGYDLDSVLTPEDEQRVEQLLAGARRDDIPGFVVDGFRVGRAALYEYLIQKKRAHTVLDEAGWAEFLPRLANVVRSLLAAQRVFDRERPTRVVAYNTLYSVNAMWRAVADARGIPVFFLHAGPSLARRLGTMIVGRDSTTLAAYRLIDAWPSQAGIPAAPAELSRVTDHFAEVLKGANVFAYSTAKAHVDWRSRFGIREGQKILVATMSSYDEYAAAHALGEQPGEASLVFPTQIEWIRALVAWIRDRPDRFLLVRVHPREFPNKRESTKSEHARMLEQELVSLPDNVRVNWPADELSLYDIAEYADVFLNAWSSVGKEMSLVGRPVVVYSPGLLMYPPDLNYVGETKQHYFEAIEAALRDGWSFERIRKAYRWSVVEYVRAVADIDDGFDHSEARASSVLGRARNLLLALPGARQNYDLLRRPRRLAQQGRLADVIISAGRSLVEFPPHSRVPIGEREETFAIRHELQRLLAALYGAERGTPIPNSLHDHLTRAAAARQL